MSYPQLIWYIESIKHEIEQYDVNFVGNVDFQFNLKGGSITNMNIGMKKSIKMPEVKTVSQIS